MNTSHQLILASRSPRRLALLREAGFDPVPRAADLDDGDLAPGSASPAAWVAALAYLKARRVRDTVPDGLILGADTVVVKDGDIIGQPQNSRDARDAITRLRSGSHLVITGVALLSHHAPRLAMTDTARVEVGPISDRQIDLYLESEEWRGKAGAYNLADRQQAGWPLVCHGDPATVMGLPLRRLAPILREHLGSPVA